MHHYKKSSKSILTVGFFTALSRLFGLVRDMLFSRVMGISFFADAFFIALRLPNIFRRITSDGAFSASFIPIFSREISISKSRSINFSENVLFYMLIIVTSLVLLAQLLMPLLVYLIAGGFSDSQSKLDITTSYARLTLPYIIFISLSSIGSAIINHQGKFFVTSLAPIFLNFFLIIALLFPNLNILDRGFLLSFSVSLSGFFNFVLIFYVLKKLNFSLRFKKSNNNESLKDFSKLAVPQTFSGFATQFNILVSGFISSFREGGISILYYAERLYQLPLALIGISIGTVILPYLASLNIRNQKDKIIDLLSITFKIALSLIIPAAFGLIFLSKMIVSVIYEYGIFGEYEVTEVSNVLIGFSFGLPAYVLIRIFSSVFYSMADTKNPLKYSLMAIGINIALSIPLFVNFGVVGIAYATSLSAWFHLIIIYVKLRRLKLILSNMQIFIETLKIIFSSLIMLLIIKMLIHNIYFLYPVISLLIFVLVGMISYMLCLFLTGVYRKSDIKDFIKDF